jgi:hypothetical protein
MGMDSTNLEKIRTNKLRIRVQDCPNLAIVSPLLKQIVAIPKRAVAMTIHRKKKVTKLVIENMWTGH